MDRQGAPSFDFTDWAGDAVFFGLLGAPDVTATANVKEPAFSEWCAAAVFSGLPAHNIMKGGEGGGNARRKENNNGVPSALIGNCSIYSNQITCSGDGGVFDKHSMNSENKLFNEQNAAVSVGDENNAQSGAASTIDGGVGGGDGSIGNKGINIFKKNLLLAAAQAAATDPTTTLASDENNVDEQHSHMLKFENAKRDSIDCVGRGYQSTNPPFNESKNICKNNLHESAEGDFRKPSLDGNDESEGRNNIGHATNFLLQVEAQEHGTTPLTAAPDQIDDKGPLNAKNTDLKLNNNYLCKKNRLVEVAQAGSAPLTNIITSEQNQTQAPLKAEIVEIEPPDNVGKVAGKSKHVVKDQMLPFHDWASTKVFSGLLKSDPVDEDIPSFNAWAGGVIFNGLLDMPGTNATTQSTPKVSKALHLGVEENLHRITNGTSEVKPHAKITCCDEAKLSLVKLEESCQKVILADNSRDAGSADCGAEDSQMQVRQTSLIKSSCQKSIVNQTRCTKDKVTEVNEKAIIPYKESFDDWAGGAVFSGLRTKPQTTYQTIPSFGEWAADIVFGGMNDKVNKEESHQDEEVNRLDDNDILDNKERVGISGHVEKSMKFSQIVLSQGVDGSGRSGDKLDKSLNFSQILSQGLDVSGRSTDKSEKSMNLSQLLSQASNGGMKGVSFRDHDSYILNRSNLMKSATSSNMNEGSVDLGTLLEDKADGIPILSQIDNLNMMDMMESIGDIEEFNGRNSSIPSQGSVSAQEEKLLPQDTNYYNESYLHGCNGKGLADCNTMDLTEKSSDFEFIESNSSIPPQRPQDMNYTDESNLSMPPQHSTISESRNSITAEEMQQLEESCTTEPPILRCPSNIEHPAPADLVKPCVTDEKKESLDHDENSLPFQGHHSERIRILVEKTDFKVQSNDFADSNIFSLDGHQGNGNDQTNETLVIEDSERSENPNKKNKVLNKATLIPRMIRVSVTKERAEERVGLVFTDKRQRVILSRMVTSSKFKSTDLRVNDELLVINGHRIKNAQKSAEFIKESCGTLSLTAFSGKRPRETVLEMMKLSELECDDLHLFTNNRLVHIVRAHGRFSRSGRIKAGDIILSINGLPVNTAERAMELLRKCSQDVNHMRLRRMHSGYDNPDDPDPEPSSKLAIILLLSLSKLRCKLIKKNELPLVKWNRAFNECAIQLPTGGYQRVLRIHNDGNCEDMIDSTDDIDPRLLQDIKSFASIFYCDFQDAMADLREVMQQTMRDCVEIEYHC